MALSYDKKRQIIQDLGIRCPVHAWHVRKGGSVAVVTRNGTRIWKPPSKPKTRRSKSGDTEA